MSSHRRRATIPRLFPLEARDLMAGGLAAQWIGQDGQDLVGPSSSLGGDGVQDIHVALSGLPASRTVTFIDVQGLGGGEWEYDGPYGPWAAALTRATSSTTADLYVEPSQVETGRPFNVSVTYDDGSKDSTWFTGGAADPNLRMPSASAKLAWIGQDGQDRVGTGVGVGPDGIQDVHLGLSNLSPGIAITDVTIRSSAGSSWDFGTNPSGFATAALDRNAADSTRADLYLQPVADPSGQTLTATITYSNGKTDQASVVAGHVNPSLAEPSTAGAMPSLLGGLTATWDGQDGGTLAGQGSARIHVSGVPAGRSVVAVGLSDPDRESWLYRLNSSVNFYSDPYAEPLGFAAGAGAVDIAFPPERNESGGVMTVRLLFDDGTSAVTTVTAGATDPALRVPNIASTSIVAHPGNDLNVLANEYGTVHLSAGTYAMTQPLVLNRPVSILADPGVTIQFSQAANAPAWSTAIKVLAGHTTLDGFAVRFATPINWAADVNYGAAVIGTTDNLDPPSSTFVDALTISHLDLQSPPVPSGDVEAPGLIRLASGIDGTVAGNTLKGGTTTVFGGSWTIVGNTYLGTVPNTYCWTAFAGHGTHDLVLEDNTAQPTGPSGKTWRFLVLTDTGYGDLIADNDVVGIGPLDTDTQSANAAEIILTESYNLLFEGVPSALSPDGRVMQIPTPQGGPAQTGDVVAILSGPDAGQYRRIAMALGSQTYLLDSPMAAGNYAISIVSGFVGETFQGNTIDARGSSVAGDMILAGDHFGTKVLGNLFLGGSDGFRITAAPSEQPVVWGWSHAPFLDATISGNVIEDAIHGATVAVEHSSAIQGDAGRVYVSGTLADNTVVWSPSFLAAHNNGSGVPGLVVGEPGSIDPGELALTASGNSSSVPAGVTAPTLDIVSGDINGLSARNKLQVLSTPALVAPTGLALIDDTGYSSTDRVTTDGRLEFNPVPGAVSYEYQVSNDAGYLPVPNPSGFLPAGLTEHEDTVWVRAIDASGNRGPTSQVSFFIQNTPPITAIPFLASGFDTGASDIDGITNIARPQFYATGDIDDTMVLLRNGVQVANRFGFGPLTDNTAKPDGTYVYSLLRISAAGNPSTSAGVTLTIDTTPPAAVSSLSASAAGVVSFAATGPDDTYQYQVGTTGGFVDLGKQTSFVASGAAAGTQIGVHAEDIAGNFGPETWITVGTPSSPSGRWIGQDGNDRVGPNSSGVPDGIQDIHIVLNGLNANRAITFVDVQGLGGGDWQYGGPYGPWRASLVRAPGSTSADLYLQPYQAETGRAFFVTIQYDDASRISFWLTGGKADPTLKDPKVGSPAALSSGGGATSHLKKKATKPKAKAKSAPHPHPHPHPAVRAAHRPGKRA